MKNKSSKKIRKQLKEDDKESTLTDSKNKSSFKNETFEFVEDAFAAENFKNSTISNPNQKKSKKLKETQPNLEKDELSSEYNNTGDFCLSMVFFCF